MSRQIGKFGLEHCGLSTMIWNVAALLRVLTLNIESHFNKGIPIYYYVVTYLTGACFFSVYLVNLCWFVFVRCRQTGDLVAGMVVLSLGTSSNIGTVKLFNMFINIKEIKKLTDGYLECDAHIISGSRYEANLLKILRFIKKRALVYWMILVCNGVLYLLKPIVYPGRNLPENYLVVYGLEPMFDTPNYEIAFAMMAAGVIFGTYVPACVTAYLIVIAGYTESQLIALSEEILNIWPDAVKRTKEEMATAFIDEYENNEIINKHVEIILKDLVKRHSAVISLFRNLQDVFRTVIAMGFFLLIFGLLTELLGKLENTYLQMPFAIMQVGMDCFVGQRVIDACTVFERAMYESKWEHFNAGNMKMVLVMLQSSQKTMTLSAGGMATLSFQCMMTINKVYFRMQICTMLGLLTLCGVLVVLWLCEKRRREKFVGIYSFPLLPFIGNVHQFVTPGDGKVLFKHLVRVTESCDNNNGRTVVWLGPKPFFVVQSPEDVKAITNAFVDKVYLYNFSKVWLGNGILTAPPSLWKQTIKKVGGTFNANVVDGYSGVFNEQASKLVAKLMDEDGKGPFNILEKYLAYITLEAICQTALGVPKISESGIITAEYYIAFNRCLELLISRGLNILTHPEWIYKLTPAYREMKKCVAILHHISDEIIRTRKQERANSKNTEANNFKFYNDVSEEPKFIAYLDILLDFMYVNPNLTEEQIKSEVDTIILAGQETVATALCFIFLMIGCHSDVQDKLYAELKTIFGESKRSTTKKDLADMKYLEAVINESLRLFPPVPIIMRYADRDLQLSKKYAMALIKTVVSHCAREFEFSSKANEMELKLDIALRAVSGHLISLRRRR